VRDDHPGPRDDRHRRIGARPFERVREVAEAVGIRSRRDQPAGGASTDQRGVGRDDRQRSRRPDEDVVLVTASVERKGREEQGEGGEQSSQDIPISGFRHGDRSF